MMYADAQCGQMPADGLRIFITTDKPAGPAESDRLAWIRSHALRKTTATALDDAGHTACQIADQLGRSKVSISQDIYIGRQAADPTAAQALERTFEDADLL